MIAVSLDTIKPVCDLITERTTGGSIVLQATVLSFELGTATLTHKVKCMTRGEQDAAFGQRHGSWQHLTVQRPTQMRQ